MRTANYWKKSALIMAMLIACGVLFSGNISNAADISAPEVGDQRADNKISKIKPSTNTVVYGGFAFEVPEEWDTQEEDEDGIYLYADKVSYPPMLAVLSIDLTEYYSSEKLKKMSTPDLYEVMAEFKSGFEKGKTVKDVSASMNVDVAGCPGITYTMHAELYKQNTVGMAEFIDIDSNMLYVLMLVEYEDAEPSRIEQLGEILSTFVRN